MKRLHFGALEKTHIKLAYTVKQTGASVFVKMMVVYGDTKYRLSLCFVSLRYVRIMDVGFRKIRKDCRDSNYSRPL